MLRSSSVTDRRDMRPPRASHATEISAVFLEITFGIHSNHARVKWTKGHHIHNLSVEQFHAGTRRDDTGLGHPVVIVDGKAVQGARVHEATLTEQAARARGRSSALSPKRSRVDLDCRVRLRCLSRFFRRHRSGGNRGPGSGRPAVCGRCHRGAASSHGDHGHAPPDRSRRICSPARRSRPR
jgi:hypothetical protein